MKTVDLTLSIEELHELDYLLVLAIGNDNRLIHSEFSSLQVRKIASEDLDSHSTLLDKIRVSIDRA